MGPPLASWRKEVRVSRHGEACCTHMLTQVAEKAPKWTFTGKAKELPPGPAPGPGLTNAPDKYSREPAYSFGGTPKLQRSFSVPVGLQNLPLQPTTPKWGFGSCPRPDPFSPSQSSGHGPAKLPGAPQGPKYSFAGRPQRKTKTSGPGPHDFRPHRPGSARAIRWGQAPANCKRPPSAPGPGPPLPGPSGPLYSLRPRLDEKPDDHWRQLGHPWSHFGYDDFGHSYGIVIKPPAQKRRSSADSAPELRHGEDHSRKPSRQSAGVRV